MTLDGRRALYLSRLAWSDCLPDASTQFVYTVAAVADEHQPARNPWLEQMDQVALSRYADHLERRPVQCAAVKRNGERCRSRSAEPYRFWGSDRCGTHRVTPAHVVEREMLERLRHFRAMHAAGTVTSAHLTVFEQSVRAILAGAPSDAA